MFDGTGWWVIFPIIGLVFMLLMMSRMFGFRRRGSGSGRGMGPMGMMGDDHEQDSEQDESPTHVRGRPHPSCLASLGRYHFPRGHPAEIQAHS